MAGRVLVPPPPGFLPAPAAAFAPAAPAAQVRPPAAPARTPAAPANLAATPQPAPRAPVVRAQGPDDLIPPPPPIPAARPREPVALPTPEQLGVAAARAAGDAVDWAAVDRRLQSLGAVCFQMNRLPQDRWCITCVLPTAQPDRTHRVEAEADTKAEAVRAVLEQAEKWAAQPK
jgi:hypothetical protein